MTDPLSPAFLDISISMFFLLVMMSVFIMTDKSIMERRIVRGIDKFKRIDSVLRFIEDGSYGESSENRILQLANIMSYEELVYLLIKADDLDRAVRDRLCEKISDLPKIRAMVDVALKGRSKLRRIEAIDVLGRLRSSAFLATLTQIVTSCGDEDIIYECIQSLGRNGSHEAASVLISLLGRNPLLNTRITATLETFDPSVAREIINRKDDLNPSVRYWVANLLGRYPGKVSADILNKMANDPDPNVRAAAVESLGKIKEVGAIDLIYKRLKDDIWFVRIHALKALGVFLVRDSVPRIAPALRDKNWHVRNNAMRTLKLYGQAAVPELRLMLHDSDRFARDSALEVLQDIGYANKTFEKFLSDGGKDGSADALVELVSSQGFKWLKSRIDDIDARARGSVLDAIRKKDEGLLEKLEAGREGQVSI